MLVAPTRRAGLAVFLDRHGPAILSTVTVAAFTGTDRIAIATPVTVAITVYGDAIGADPYVGLRQRDQTIRGARNACEGREGR